MAETARFHYDKNYSYLVEQENKIHKPQYRLWLATRGFSEVYMPLGLKPGNHILDVGSCIGTLGHYFKYAGVRTTGVDINMAALQSGKRIFGNEKNNQSLVAGTTHLPFANSQFNTVFSEDVFEHLPDLESAKMMLDEVSRVNKGKRMLHKITVLEDKDWIDADLSHRIKKPAEFWKNWFDENGWKTIAPTTKKFPVWNRRHIGLSQMHGYFLLEKK